MNPEPAHAIGKPAHPLGEPGVAVMATIVDKGRFRPASGGQVPLDQIGGGVVCRSALHQRASLRKGRCDRRKHYISRMPTSSAGRKPRTMNGHDDESEGWHA